MQRAIEAFYFAYRAFTAGPDTILARQKLNRVHHRILYFVGRNPAINVNELLAILQVSKQALNAPLRTLVEKGLVDSRAAAHDGRVRELSLTAAGRDLEEQLTRTQAQHLQQVFSEYDGEAVGHWLAIMENTAGPG